MQYFMNEICTVVHRQHPFQLFQEFLLLFHKKQPQRSESAIKKQNLQ